MPTQEEILLTILGRDEASNVFNQIGSNAQSAFSGIKSTADDSARGLADSYMGAVGSISTALSELNVGMMSLNSVNRQVMGTLGATKSAADYVFGTTATAETNKVLVQGWADAKVSAEDLYNTVDKVTDSSLTSMQDLIPAMNAFRAATSATGTELKESVAENMAQFGAYVLSLTGSEALAKTAMSDLSKGIKGRWASLDQYGVSEDALKATGKWSGEEDDIKGYMEAVREVSGAVEELMNTSQGTDALLGKMWSRAGKRIGNEYLPGITSIKNAFLELDNEMEGNLSTNILAVSLAIEQLSGMAYKFSTLVNGFRDISKVVYTAGQYLGFFGSMMSVEEEALYYDTLMKEQNAQLTAENTMYVDDNTMARYDNIDAMYQQQSAMAGLNDTTIVNDGLLASNSVSNNALPLPNGGGIDAVRNSEMVKDNKSASSAISKTQEELKEIDNLNDLYSNQQQILGNVEKNMLQRNEAIEQINKLDDSFLGKNVTKSQLIEYLQFQNDIENEFTNWAKYRGSPVPMSQDSWGAKLPTSATSKFDKKNSPISSLEEMIASNADERKRVADLQEALKKHDDALDNLELSDKPYTRFKNKLQNIWGRKHNYSQDIPDIDSEISNVGNKITKIGQNIRSKIGTAFTNLKTSLQYIRADGVEGNLNNIFNKIGNTFKNLRGATKTVEDIPDVDIDIGKKAKPVVKAGEELAEVGATAGAVAPEMAEASAGLSFMGLAEMGLAGAFTTLIVPTLAIAAVIAILIPIIAGLTIEAMFFLKIIQQFFVSMNFGGINMEESIEGIKQLAIGLGYVALAMGALLAVNIITGIMAPFLLIGQIFGGGLTGALDLAITSLKQAADKIKEFSNIQIDPNIATNLGNLSEALNSISRAMLSLAGIQISTGITGFLENILGLKSTSEALDTAKDDIIEASTKLQEFSNVTPIDEETAQKIQNVCDTLGSVGDAFGGLQKIRDSQNFDILGGIANLFGGVDIKKALTDAHQTIVDASQVLGDFGDVEAIDPNIGESIKSVGTALSSIGEAIGSLQQIRDTFNGANLSGQESKISVPKLNILGFEAGGFDLIKNEVPSALDALREVRRTIITASKGLMAFNDMPDIKGLGIPNKIKAFTTAISQIGNAVTGMNNIRDISKGGGFGNGDSRKTNIAEDIANVRRSIITTAKGLQMFTTMPDIQSLGIPARLKAFSSTLNSIKNAVNRMVAIGDISKGQNFGDIANSIRDIRRTIIVVSQGLHGMATDPNFKTIDAGLSSKINSVTKAVGSLKKASNGLTGFPNVNVGDVETKTKNAADAVKKASSNIRTIKSGDKVKSSVTSAINSVNKGAKKLKTVAKTFTGFPNVSAGTVQNKIKNAVDAVKKTASELKNLSKDDKVGSVSSVLNSVKRAISSLKKTLKETTNFHAEGKSIGSSLKSGMKGGLSGLNGIVTSAVAAAGNAGKAYASTYGKGMGSSMTSGFKTGLQLKEAMSTEMSAVVSAVDNGISEAKSHAQSGASEVVQAFKDGINAKSPGDIYRTMKAEMGYTSDAITSSFGKMRQNSQQLGEHIVKGFKPSLRLNGLRSLSESINRSRADTVRSMNRTSQLGKTQRPVNISIGEGAVQLDARNMTAKESRQIMISALEGLDVVKGIEISKN